MLITGIVFLSFPTVSNFFGQQKANSIIEDFDDTLDYVVPENGTNDKIPASVDPAYVLTADVPSHIARTWTRLYDCEYRGKHLYIYKGVSLKKELSDDDDYYDYDYE